MIKNILLFFLLSNISFASEVDTQNSKELLKILIKNHPTIKMAQEAINASKEKVDSAFWGFFPTPSVDVSAKDGSRYTTVARLDQPVWTGGKLTSAYDISKSQEQDSYFSMQKNAYDLIDNFLGVLQNYFKAKNTLREYEKGLQNHLELLDMLDRRMDAGVSTSSDKELLNSRIQQIKNSILSAQNSLEIATVQLELMLDIQITSDVVFEPITINYSHNMKETIDKILQYHPSIKQIDAQIQTAKYDVDSTKASIMPNLSLRLEHKRGDLYNEDYDRETSNQDLVYLTFTANTKAGLSGFSDINAANIKVKELVFKKESIKQELVSAILSDYNNYEATKRQITILENSIESSQNVLDSYTRLFIAGKKQWLNLVDASRELMNYKVNLVNLYVTRDILRYEIALKRGQINLTTGDFK